MIRFNRKWVWSSFLLVLLLPLLIQPNRAQPPEKTYTLALFLPRERGDSFWDLVSDFMQAACKDMNMKLRFYYAHNNKVLAKQQIQEAATGPNKVDALVFQNFEQAGPEFLQIAEQAHVPALIIDTGLDDSDKEKWGMPREQLHYWLGEFLPDNEEAGFDLANYLINRAKEQKQVNAEGKVQMVGLAGTTLSHASIDRIKGLKIAIQNRQDVILHEVIPAYWKREEAQKQFVKLYKRYPHQINVGWGANDPMALGILDAAHPLGFVPNQTLIGGGVDWTTDAMKAIQSGKMAASVGGHFMLGGWAAILLYDYFHGFDFAEESVEMRLRMDLLTQENIGPYWQRFGHGNWDTIDFRRFSKALNPQLVKYNFRLKAIMTP